jgi:hypothetical protein
MMIAPETLKQVTGLPEELMRYTGLFLILFAIFLLFLATRQLSSRSPVWVAILLNVLWIADSFLILATGWVTPTQFGYVLVIAQALVVAVVAALEYVGLRKSVAAPA